MRRIYNVVHCIMIIALGGLVFPIPVPESIMELLFNYKLAFFISGYGICSIVFHSKYYSQKIIKRKYLFISRRVTIFTLIGLVCHYVVEYGEKSAVTAFSLKNISLYILSVVIYTCAVYSISEIHSK
jgi:hypothetical protein